jgi:Tol biopolymer transport system component
LLTKLGVFHGSMPSRLNFAPDGSKFAFFSPFTLNPNEWLQSLIVCELNLEKPIEMLVKDPVPKPSVTPTTPETEPVAPISSPTGEQLLESGMAWSPDSKFLAFSVAKFAAQSPVYKVFIKDLSDNKTLLKIPNANQPSWGAL